MTLKGVFIKTQSLTALEALLASRNISARLQVSRSIIVHLNVLFLL
jgi:hypothetical protein